MKTKLSFILLFLSTVMGIAATLTIEVPQADLARISEAFGVTFNLGHNANVNEVSEATRRYIMDVTKNYERDKARVAYSPPPLEMQPTPLPSPSPSPSPTPTATP